LRAHGHETPRLFDLGGDAQLLQRGGMALEHLCTGRDELEEQPPGLFAVLGNQSVETVGFESPSSTLDLVIRNLL